MDFDKDTQVIAIPVEVLEAIYRDLREIKKGLKDPLLTLLHPFIEKYTNTLVELIDFCLIDIEYYYGDGCNEIIDQDYDTDLGGGFI